MFFKYTNDSDSLKSIVDDADAIIRWAILEKLIVKKEGSFVEEFLLQFLKGNINNEEKGKASEILVSLQNIQGLKVYVEWVKQNIKNNIKTSHIQCLYSLNLLESIPYLIDLLEFSYLENTKVDHFRYLNSHILEVFSKIALISHDNFIIVRDSLQKFMDEKTAINESVKYIIQSIERIEDQFYMSNAQSFNINEVKEKLELIK